MSVNHIDKTKCCGCGACSYICPFNAIKMIADDEGFLYPKVDTSLCIECGLCEKKCGFHDLPQDTPKPQSAFALQHKENKVLSECTSGGAFTVISDIVLNHNGSVYGVVFDENMTPVFQKACTGSERDKMRGSKYVQANLSTTIYESIENDLKNWKEVLFVGTPCQVSAVKSTIKGSHEKLILVDLICTGVPSPKLWFDHIRNLEKKYNSKVVSYQCRSKIFGWHTHMEVAEFSNGKRIYWDLPVQAHKRIFHGKYSLRPSCYQCPFASSSRCSDITIGDYWGIEKKYPNMDNNLGTSLVIVHTEKGRNLLDIEAQPVNIMETPFEDALQPRLLSPTPCPATRGTFWNDYTQHGYWYIIKKYAKCNFKNQLLNIAFKLKRSIKK